MPGSITNATTTNMMYIFFMLHMNSYIAFANNQL